MLCDGIFNSKVLYCLQVFGNIWGFGYDETTRRSYGFTREDSRRLQVLQNKVCRLKTGLGYDVSTEHLLKVSKDLSTHQLTAYHTLVTVHKVKVSHKPEYLNDRLKFNPISGTVSTRRMRLTITRGGFVYRGGLLWNQLPDRLRTLSNTANFKKETRKWVEQNVAIKPG